MSNNYKKNKKLLSSVICASVATSTIVAFAPQAGAEENKDYFKDVNKNDHFYEAVKSLNARGVIKGYDDQTFRPYSKVTRAQAAKIIAMALNMDTKNVKDPGFKDVTKSDWAYGYVAALANAGIIQGYDDQFKPNEPLSRAQMAKIIALSFKFEKGQLTDSPFTDVKKDDWFAEYVKPLLDKEITTGTTPTTFSPNKPVLRGQMASFIIRSEQSKSKVSSEIINITEKEIVLKSGTYELTEELKTWLNSTNLNALKGARMNLSLIDGKIKKIEEIELTASGKASLNETAPYANHVVFDGKGAVIDADVIVNGDFTTLQNVTIKGNLQIGKSVEKSFYAESVKVEGKTIISDEAQTLSNKSLNRKSYSSKYQAAAAKDSADGASVIFNNSNLNQLDINKPNAVIEYKGNTKTNAIMIGSLVVFQAEGSAVIAKLIIPSGVNNLTINANVGEIVVMGNGNITISGSGDFGSIIASEQSVVSLQTTGKIGMMETKDKESKFLLGNDTKVENLKFPNGVKPNEVIKNYDQVKGNIEKVGGEKNPDVPSSGGGGGGGSAPSISVPRLSEIEIGSISLNPLDGSTLGKVSAKSSKKGYLYLVPKNTVKTVDALNAAVNNQGESNFKVAARKAVAPGVAREFDLTEFSPGSYVLYAVDSSGNISNASEEINVTGVTFLTRALMLNMMLFDSPKLPNAFKEGSSSEEFTGTEKPLYAFGLYPLKEKVAIGQIDIQASEVQGITEDDLKDLKLYSFTFDGEKVEVPGVQFTSISEGGVLKTIRVSGLSIEAIQNNVSEYVPLFVLAGTVDNLVAGDKVTLSLNKSNIKNVVGDQSGKDITIYNFQDVIDLDNIPGLPQIPLYSSEVTHLVGEPEERVTVNYFTDLDPSKGEISGELTWVPGNADGTTQYVIRYVNILGDKIGEPISEVDADVTSFAIRENTSVPASAVGIGVFAKNDNGESSVGGTILLQDHTPPFIKSAFNRDNQYIDIIFNEGVYGDNGQNEAIEVSDLKLSFVKGSGTATNVKIKSLGDFRGDPLYGGETQVRAYLEVEGIPNGKESISITPADGSSIFNGEGTPVASSETTGVIRLRDKVAPAAVQGLSVKSEDTDTEAAGGVRNILKWEPNTETDLEKYYIYRTEAGIPEFQLAEVDGDVESFTDEEATPEKAYTYTIVAVDKYGNESPGTDTEVVTANDLPIQGPVSGLRVEVTRNLEDNTATVNVSPAAATADGNKFVYKLSEETNPPRPNVGEILSGWDDLPENGEIQPSFNVQVAEVTSSGAVVKYGVSQTISASVKNGTISSATSQPAVTISLHMDLPDNENIEIDLNSISSWFASPLAEDDFSAEATGETVENVGIAVDSNTLTLDPDGLMSADDTITLTFGNGTDTWAEFSQAPVPQSMLKVSRTDHNATGQFKLENNFYTSGTGNANEFTYSPESDSFQ